MIEIKIKDNPTNLQGFICEYINIKKVPDEELQILTQSYECIIAKHFETYVKRKREGKKKTKNK